MRLLRVSLLCWLLLHSNQNGYELTQMKIRYLMIALLSISLTACLAPADEDSDNADNSTDTESSTSTQTQTGTDTETSTNTDTQTNTSTQTGTSTQTSTGTETQTSTDVSLSITVSGLFGSGLMLSNNSTDSLSITENGVATFDGLLQDGDAFNITIDQQPESPTQSCVLQYGSGIAGSTDIDTPKLTCVWTVVDYRIVDTNQTNCYNSGNGEVTTCIGIGVDAHYSSSPPSYNVTDNGETITDSNTGLVWTQSPDTDNNGTVDYSDKMSQSDAVSYCADLDLAGYQWRLPSIKEAYSLIQFSGEDPSSYTGTDTSTLTLFIDEDFEKAFGDQTAGERIIDGQYASSTIYVSTTMNGDNTMFGVNFVDGRIKGYPTTGNVYYVLCVAGNTKYGINNFVDNGDNTISDSATNLMWHKNDTASSDWDDAITLCESDTTANHDDWRLPDVKELHSIVDYSRSPDTTSSAAIDPIFNATAITNEAGVTDYGYYWASTTHVDYDGLGRNGTYISFGEALGYFNGQMMDVHGAGAQRSNGKKGFGSSSSTDIGFGSFYYHGPQGDILRLDNKVRCVRSM